MQTKQFTALLYGWIVVLGLVLISSVILALFLHFTTLNQPTLSWITLGVGLLSLFIGGFVAGVEGKNKGWIIGGMVGIGFTFLTFLVQYLGFEQIFSFEQTIHHAGYILAALVGGMLGVNIVGRQS